MHGNAMIALLFIYVVIETIAKMNNLIYSGNADAVDSLITQLQQKLFSVESA